MKRFFNYHLPMLAMAALFLLTDNTGYLLAALLWPVSLYYGEKVDKHYGV